MIQNKQLTISQFFKPMCNIYLFLTKNGLSMRYLLHLFVHDMNIH